MNYIWIVVFIFMASILSSQLFAQRKAFDPKENSSLDVIEEQPTEDDIEWGEFEEEVEEEEAKEQIKEGEEEVETIETIEEEDEEYDEEAIEENQDALVQNYLYVYPAMKTANSIVGGKVITKKTVAKTKKQPAPRKTRTRRIKYPRYRPQYEAPSDVYIATPLPVYKPSVRTSSFKFKMPPLAKPPHVKPIKSTSVTSPRRPPSKPRPITIVHPKDLIDPIVPYGGRYFPVGE